MGYVLPEIVRQSQGAAHAGEHAVAFEIKQEQIESFPFFPVRVIVGVLNGANASAV